MQLIDFAGVFILWGGVTVVCLVFKAIGKRLKCRLKCNRGKLSLQSTRTAKEEASEQERRDSLDSLNMDNEAAMLLKLLKGQKKLQKRLDSLDALAGKTKGESESDDAEDLNSKPSKRLPKPDVGDGRLAV